jgi:hypothetical protein
MLWRPTFATAFHWSVQFSTPDLMTLLSASKCQLLTSGSVCVAELETRLMNYSWGHTSKLIARLFI